MISRRTFATALTAGTAVKVSGQRRSDGNPVKEGKSIDTHAHVFTRDLRFAADSRYVPTYDATPSDYLRLLDRHGLACGVLVQPSFLGTDNRYLLDAVRASPKRLRGVVVVDPARDVGSLSAMDREGAVGIRLNLFGLPDPDLESSAWKKTIAKVVELDWLFEVHCEAERLRRILPRLLAANAKVVIDHFGRPNPELGIDDAGFRYLCSLGSRSRVWVKISGAYRNGDGGRGEAIAEAALPLLREAFGWKRLLWGSDWPHTQNEKTMSFDRSWKLLQRIVPDPAPRNIILVESPKEPYRF